MFNINISVITLAYNLTSSANNFTVTLNSANILESSLIVDGSCAEHLTVESYTLCSNSHTYYY